jgi:CubicO group peptidase (beta-lactamase class C family)
VALTATETVTPTGGDPELAQILAAVIQKHDIPAMAAAIVTSKGLQKAGVAGVRKRNTTVAASIDDLWHLGSNTKAMTATLAGILVEKGVLDWDTEIAACFPELKEGIEQELRKVTITQLLAHRSGLPANLAWRSIIPDGSVMEQRRAAAELALWNSPEYPPSSKTLYSNLGYVIAGAMIEAKTGRSWEENMRELVFAPLDMSSAGFGGLGTPGEIDQPWGHLSGGKPVDINGPKADNALVIGPAGTVHCTIQDWAKFVADQLRGARGKTGLLSVEGYQKIQGTPFDDQYGLGWLVLQREWAGGKALNHCGCNTMFYANVWMAPQRDFAILVCANQGTDAFDSTNDAVGRIIQLIGAGK